MASFTITPTTATFRAIIRGSQQRISNTDLQQLTLGVLFNTDAEWLTLQGLVTTKYHVHVPLGGDVVVDVVRGPGEGDLSIENLGDTTAILVGLDRPTYLPNERSIGSATFLITGDPL